MPYFCYLLRSLETEKSTRTYVGFTTNPKRRIRQHNGELKSGARRTSKHRPWSFVVVISGFPNKIVALQFEWQLQHPAESRIVRTQGGSASHPKGWKGKLSILACMLQTSLWKQLNLRLNFVFHDAQQWFLRSRQIASCVEAVAVSLDDISCAKEKSPSVPLAPCGICSVNGGIQWVCENCQRCQHLSCTAQAAMSSSSPDLSSVPSSSPSFIPKSGSCHGCDQSFPWIEIVRATRQYEETSTDESDLELQSDS
jgi:predicted GIY-YIG superfamily endonuclease